MRRLILAAALSCAILPVAAQGHGIEDFAATPENGVSWEMLTATQPVAWVDENGINRLAPEFGAAIEKLDGTEVIVAGYQMSADEPSAHFTLYGSAVDCVFHLDAGPNMRIEIEADIPPAATPHAITLRGRLELVRARSGGVFYRLRDAKVIDDKV